MHIVSDRNVAHSLRPKCPGMRLVDELVTCHAGNILIAGTVHGTISV